MLSTQGELARQKSKPEADAADETLQALAKNAMESTETTEDAVDTLLASVKGQRSLREAMVEQAARSLIHRERSAQRARLERQAWAETKADTETPVKATFRIPAKTAKSYGGVTQDRAESYYDWYMPGSTKALGDATVEDLRAAASAHRAAAQGAARKETFYTNLSVLLEKSGAATVRQGIKEKKIADVIRESGADKGDFDVN